MAEEQKDTRTAAEAPAPEQAATPAAEPAAAPAAEQAPAPEPAPAPAPAPQPQAGAAPVPPAPPYQPQSPQGGYQQVPPAQGYQQAPPMYAPQPVYVPAPLTQLTGGMKFAWVVVGALLGIPGIIISWLVNVDKVPQVKSDAVKFSVIGFVINIALAVLVSLMIGGFLAALAAGLGSYGYSSYYGAW